MAEQENRLEVKLSGVRELKLSTARDKNGVLVGRLTFDVVGISPMQVARLLTADQPGLPLDVVVTSPQARFDIRIVPIDLATGQILDHQ